MTRVTESEKRRMLRLLKADPVFGVKRSQVDPPGVSVAVDGGPAMRSPAAVVNALRDEGWPIDSMSDGSWVLLRPEQHRPELRLPRGLAIVEQPAREQLSLGDLDQVGRSAYDAQAAA